MRKNRTLAALGAIVVVAAGVAGCGGSGVAGDSVAAVAGNQISNQAFKHWMYVAAKGNAAQSQGSPVIVPTDPPDFKGCIKQVRQQLPSLKSTSDKELKSECSQLFTQMNGQVLAFLIESYWYQADAAKMGIKLTDKQVNAAYQKARKAQFPTSAEYKSFLSQSGQTDADIRFRVRVNTLYEKLIKKYTKKTTAADIASYYKAHKSQFGTPQTRDIRIVLAKTKANAQAALSDLKAGQSWTTVTKKYSTDSASKSTGGLLKGVEQGQEDQALNSAAFSAPVHKLVGPIKSTYGWYVVEVDAIHPAVQAPLSKAKATIKQTLTQQNQTAAANKINSISKKNWGKQTLCDKAYSMNFCNGYKAPKTTASAAPATTAPATTAPATTAPATTAPATTTPATTAPAATPTASATTSTPAATSTPATTTAAK